MAQKTDDGPAKATAEDLRVLAPEEVPVTVEYSISKRTIPGADARQVVFMKGKARWVHKRFLGEFDAPEDDDDELDLDYDELDEDYAAELAAGESQAGQAPGGESPGEQPAPAEAAPAD